ncbi:MAG: UDP-N-acetylmuramoyl-L-alanyl-D-glutamate--2,6-diaminopimelate ligase [Betaproteobacteria bacterium]|nr:UDP-N-acetylmuramoyl-L-alanyl-D-glutamate--2,6-diaminopimelate ligase [Betaproteobacteria bacterium]
MSTAPAAILHSLGAQHVPVKSLCADSRAVRPGDVFIAYPGAAADGRAFIPQAIAQGARAVVWERTDFSWNQTWTVPHCGIDELRHAVGPLAQEVYGQPSRRMWVVGVTGTNGKTSASQWIVGALNTAGRTSAVIGTLGIGLPDRLVPNPNTTPDPIVLAKAMADFVRDGACATAMEVSSIGLDQGRVDGVQFACAVFTNLSRDHLDYHKDMAAYAKAKARLFDFSSLTHIVTNLDDELGRTLGWRSADRNVRCIGYTLSSDHDSSLPCDIVLQASAIEHDPTGVRFHLQSSLGSADVRTRLFGRFNVANMLAVSGALIASGLTFEKAVALLSDLPPVAGRMEMLGGRDTPKVIVDYAHTPDALDKVLRAARDVANANRGRLIVVFGCGGDRDRGKRPLMGALAAELADEVIVTSDNPRSEDPPTIMQEIVAGMPPATEAICIEDRAAAIRQSLAGAQAGDVVVLAGKGHEPYQEIAGVRRPFSDLLEARAALKALTC